MARNQKHSLYNKETNIIAPKKYNNCSSDIVNFSFETFLLCISSYRNVDK